MEMLLVMGVIMMKLMLIVVVVMVVMMLMLVCVVTETESIKLVFPLPACQNPFVGIIPAVDIVILCLHSLQSTMDCPLSTVQPASHSHPPSSGLVMFELLWTGGGV